MKSRKLPENLQAAYDWTAAAGELDDLRTGGGKALDTYCRESAENWRRTRTENDTGSVTEADLHDLHDWLVGR